MYAVHWWASHSDRSPAFCTGHSGRSQLHLHQPGGQVHSVHLYNAEVTVAMATYTYTSQVVRYTLYTCTMYSIEVTVAVANNTYTSQLIRY